MLDGAVLDDAASGLQVTDNVLVSVEDQLALVLRHLGSELTVHVHRNDDIDAVFITGVHIVFTEGRRLVDHTSTVLGGDIIGHHDLESVRVICEVVEDRLVGQTFQVSTSEGSHDLVFLAQFLGVGTNQRFCQQEGLTCKLRHGGILADLNYGVGDLRVHGQTKVGRQRPRRGGPSDSRSISEHRVVR